jgi:hypothetical protein
MNRAGFPGALLKPVIILLLQVVLLMPLARTAAAVNPPDEGMWLPFLVQRLNYTDMQKMGLRLTAEELYSINNSSLKDAIAGLSGGGATGGFFCTAEVVSSQGLIFTNHHCGYGAVQDHSTPEHDYLTTGFWAMSTKDELPNEGMCASFLVRMADVTDSIIPFLSDTMSEASRSAKVREIGKRISKAATENDKYEATVKEYYGGNEYYLLVYITYRDVRLVGAPPSSVGKFGGDTDNWMWPRHTGDFTIFRIYGDSLGNPAPYSENNIPIKPKYHLPISLKGIQKDDFAMIWGFPGRTSRYLTSYGIDYNVGVFYPTLIELFGKRLEIMKERMDVDKKVKIDYADTYAGIANTWKNFIGQEKMLKKNRVADKKIAIEQDFTAWYGKDPALQKKYSNVLPSLKTGYADLGKITVPFYFSNIAGSGLDLVGYAGSYSELASALEKKNKAAADEAAKALKEGVEEHFKSKDFAIEKKTFTEMLKLYAKKVQKQDLPSIFTTIEEKYDNNIDAFANDVYTNSIFATAANANAFLSKPNLKTLEKDLGWQTMESMTGARNKYMGSFNKTRTEITAGNRLFIAGLRQMNPDKVFYPDANSTLRMTYGKVLDYYPADAVHYNFFTTLKGVMEKEDATNDEFYVEPKLKDLFKMKDYGDYGLNGELVTCFLTTNDITGGNSGSPVINANGELIGIAFDGNWEAMSGDIMFEPALQRTINVDIRYVLFIIDKYAGATNLIKELTLVK